MLYACLGAVRLTQRGDPTTNHDKSETDDEDGEEDGEDGEEERVAAADGQRPQARVGRSRDRALDISAIYFGPVSS